MGIVSRLALIAVLAAVLSAELASPAGAESVLSKQQAAVTFTADGVPTSPQPVSMNLRAWFDSIAADLDREVQFTTVDAAFFFEGGLVTNVADFPSCTPVTVFQDDAMCPVGSQVATGNGMHKGLGLDEALTIKAFNAGAGAGMTLLVTGETPLIIREVVIVTLPAVADARYRTSMSFSVPRNLQSPAPGVIAAFTDFRLDFPVQYAASNGVPLLRNGQKIPYIATSNSCTGFKYVANYTTTFDSAISGSQTVESPSTCVVAPIDRDGDGRPDASDACPDQPAATANGCPADADGDGRPDASDRCPSIAATTPSGCPPPAPPALTVRGKQAVGRGKIKLKIKCNQPCQLAIAGTVGAFRLRPVRGQGSPVPTTLTVTVSAADLKKLRKLLKKRRFVKATIKITATVPDGSQVTKRVIKITK